MTATAATAESTAAKVPVFSLPQTELLTVSVNDIPVLKDSLGAFVGVRSKLSKTIGCYSFRYGPI